MHCGKCPALMAASKSCKSLKCQTCFRRYNCRKAQVDGLHAWQQDKIYIYTYIYIYLVPPKPPGQRQRFMPVAVIVTADVWDCKCSHKVKWSSWETVASRLPYIAPSTNFEVFMLKVFFFSPLKETTCCCEDQIPNLSTYHWMVLFLQRLLLHWKSTFSVTTHT